MSRTIAPGSRVTLHLSLTLEDGTVAESTFGSEPFSFTLGDGSLLRGLEIALFGLEPGARQRLQLSPQQAWGLHDPQQVRRLSRADFPAEMELAPGVIVGFETGAGEEVAGTVLQLDHDHVEVDFNHPLAGHSLLFEVEILDVEPATGDD